MSEQYSKNDLKNMGIVALKKIAQSNKIPGYTKYNFGNKQDLAEKIFDLQSKKKPQSPIPHKPKSPIPQSPIPQKSSPARKPLCYNKYTFDNLNSMTRNEIISLFGKLKLGGKPTRRDEMIAYLCAVEQNRRCKSPDWECDDDLVCDASNQPNEGVCISPEIAKKRGFKWFDDKRIIGNTNAIKALNKRKPAPSPKQSLLPTHIQSPPHTPPLSLLPTPKLSPPHTPPLPTSPKLSPPPHTPLPAPTILYNITYTHTLDNFSFGNLSKTEMIEIFKDGRAFSHFIEPWLAFNYSNLHHVKGCKKHDHVNMIDENIKYDQKTFTKRGCNFMPSNMVGQGRKFNQEIFKEKAKNLIYIIVSNINFPEIKVKFVHGIDLLVKYPKGIIQLKDFDKFFN